MANEIVKPHKFEVSKNKIHSLSTSVSNVSLQKFPTEGSIFPWNDHNITGDEANTLLVSPLQSALISQNTSIRSLFNIADEVYNALESLDKEYIQGIIAAVKSAEIASDQAKAASTKANTASNQALEASRKALDASTKATTAQADIKRTIEALQTTVRILKEFKEKVTKDLSSHKTNLASFHQQVDAFVEKADQTTARIDGDIEALKQYRTFLESYQHLGDVDSIWSDVEGHKTNLASFHQQVDAFVEKVNQATARIDGDIEALKQYRTLLESYQHLGDVDSIWSDVEGHKTNLLGLHEKVNAFIKETHSGQERIEGLIHQLEEDNHLAHMQYNKEIKIAFWLGGSAVGLIVINYILQIIGVL
jgi:chromosome segregation ATPase